MGELGDILELLHGARHRYHSVRATVDERHHQGDGARSERLVRLWYQPPDRIRMEARDAEGRTVAIRDGGRWWVYDADGGVHSNEDEPDVGADIAAELLALFDPAPLLGVLRLEPRGAVEVAGRRAFAVHGAVRHPGRDWTSGARFLHGAGEHELAVERERGILLRQAALRDGAPMSILEVVEIAFDEAFAAETFAPIAGVRQAPRIRSQELPLDDAARAVPFRVFALRGLAPGWVVRSGYFPGDPTEPVPAQVSLAVAREDGSRRAFVTQTDAREPFPEPEPARWDPVEHARRRLEVASPERGGAGETHVRLDRDGTRIELRSPNMGEAELLELVESLVPVGAA